MDISSLLSCCSSIGIVLSNVEMGSLFLGAPSLDPSGRPRFAYGATVDAGCLVIEMRVGVLVASTCDFVTCAALLKASSSFSIIWFKCKILLTSSFASVVLGSCQNGFLVCNSSSVECSVVPVLAILSEGNISSRNWQSLYLALKMSIVVGLRYLIIKGESNPT